MDRYLLLVTWREGKFRSMAGAEIEPGTEASSLESTDKQPRKLWARRGGKDRRGGEGFEFLMESRREERRSNGPGNAQLSEVVYIITELFNGKDIKLWILDASVPSAW